MNRNLLLLSLVLTAAAAAVAQPSGESGEQPAGPPPAIVVVADVEEIVLSPDSEFLGTLYYNVESEIAAEVSGLVSEAMFEAGMRVEKGAPLVRLNGDLLEQDLLIAEATLAELEVALEKARVDLARSEKLFAEKSVSEQVFDNDRFAVKTRERQVEIQKSRISRIKTELSKLEIRAPYSGAILEKHTDVGAWVGSGDAIARIAQTDEIDLIANVPQNVVGFLQAGREVQATINNQMQTGRIFAIIQEGDIATRTFPVRVRMPNTDGAYLEGMEGFVRLPTGSEVACLSVPRDAVMRQPTGTVVYTVENGAAAMHPVTIVGYTLDRVGVQSPSLKAGMQVVTKGNERLQPGQPLDPRDSVGGESSASRAPQSANDEKES